MNYNNCDEMCCEMMSPGLLNNNWVCLMGTLKCYKYVDNLGFLDIKETLLKFW
jgi:hypothetical protein